MNKKHALSLAVLTLIITGCNSTGPLSGLGGAGESWKFVNPKLSVVGSTINISADEWIHVGTNGFPLPAGTNDAMIMVPGPLYRAR